jgi:6-phosphogluconolactonase
LTSSRRNARFIAARQYSDDPGQMSPISAHGGLGAGGASVLDTYVSRRGWTKAISGGALLAIALSAIVGNATTVAASARGEREGPTTVYTISNASASAGGNAVLVFRAHRGGGVTPLASIATGGDGTGSGLGSQGAVALADSGSRLLAVNAGSNTVSAFAIGDGGRLRLLAIAPSGGSNPISVTAHGRLVYVLNAGDNTVSGLRLDEAGINAIAGSTRALSAGAIAPVQVSFTPDGEHVIVPEKASDTIDSFAVGSEGRLHGLVTTTVATGTTPFGFDFDAAGHAILSDAAGGAAGASAVTSFRVGEHGALHAINTVGDLQTAACWVVTDRRGGHAYVANTGSGTVSSYDVDGAGNLTLRASVAATTGGHAADEALAGGTLFVLTGSANGIASASELDSGDLGAVHIGAAGLPAGVSGLVAVTED